MIGAHFHPPHFSLPGVTIGCLLVGVVVLRLGIWIVAPGL